MYFNEQMRSFKIVPVYKKASISIENFEQA